MSTGSLGAGAEVAPREDRATAPRGDPSRIWRPGSGRREAPRLRPDPSLGLGAGLAAL